MPPGRKLHPEIGGRYCCARSCLQNASDVYNPIHLAMPRGGLKSNRPGGGFASFLHPQKVQDPSTIQYFPLIIEIALPACFYLESTSFPLELFM